MTSKTGDTVLQLFTVHGDVALQLPLDQERAPVALDSDEYGNPREGQAPARYNWLGAKQRSTETLTGLTLMGVRLYNPTIGRFLSVDPVYGGNLNAYEYAHADPLNRYDLDGKWSWAKRKWKTFRKKSWRKWIRRTIRIGAAVGAAVGTGVICAATAGVGCIAAGFVLGAASGSIDYQARFFFQRKKRMNRTDHVKNIGLYAIPGTAGATVGKLEYLKKFFRGSGKLRR